MHLAALKIGGNPTATGSSAARSIPRMSPCGWSKPDGAATEVNVSSGVGAVSALVSADLLETPRSGDEPPLTLHGYQIATVLARLDVHAVLDADGAALAPEAETAQPLYARYWLHNRGPAPLGGLPAVAHLHPQPSPPTR